jgi:hypothetical protein
MSIDRSAFQPTLKPKSLEQLAVNNAYAAGVGAVVGIALGQGAVGSALATTAVYDGYVGYEYYQDVKNFNWDDVTAEGVYRFGSELGRQGFEAASHPFRFTPLGLGTGAGVSIINHIFGTEFKNPFG